MNDTLDALDPEVGNWWKNSGGLVKRRDATSLSRMWLWNEAERTENGSLVFMLDFSYDEVEAALAIIIHARGGGWSSSFRIWQINAAGCIDVDAFQAWQQQEFSEAVQQAAAWAEAYYKGVASISALGTGVVLVSELAGGELNWGTVLDLVGHIPVGKVAARAGIAAGIGAAGIGAGAIIVKFGDKVLDIPVKLLEKYQKLSRAAQEYVIAAVARLKQDEVLAKLPKILDEAASCAPVDRGVPHSATPVGRSGNPLGSVQPNAPTTIGGRPYSGHAIDRMQQRGIPPPLSCREHHSTRSRRTRKHPWHCCSL
jgi:hypothetical protein